MRSLLFITTLLCCCCSFLGMAQNQQERILNFEVEIKMNKDRSIDVYEKIEVFSNGDQIKRGITRGLPTRRYIEDQKYIVKYENLKVQRGGQDESYHIKEVIDGQMLYLGKADFLLPKGKYVYEIRYHVPNQIEWLDEFDRLRWNAIGTDISFVTDKARIKIVLPNNTTLLDADTYIGQFGARGNQSRIQRVHETQSISFNIDEGLKPGEGITTSLQIEKGAILQPTLLEKKGSLISILISSGLLLFYFVFTWFRYGRDPEVSESGLLYDTPENLSPAAISYIRSGSYRDRSMTSSIISLAVKGFIHIETIDGGSNQEAKYVIQRLKTPSAELPLEELTIMEHLFNHHAEFVLDGVYDRKVVALNRAHEKAIKTQHQAFVEEGNNLRLVVIPILIVLITIGVSLALSFIFGLGSLAVWKQLLIFIPTAIIGLVIYRKLIVQPTLEKVNLLSEIEGFKSYIALNHSDRANLESAPGIDKQHYESILPHAFAFGLEKKWFGLFEDYLNTASYQPSWTNHNHTYIPGFHTQFYGQMRHASYQPPSDSGGFSSGGSGGGFSGGGGGGGSVGGW